MEILVVVGLGVIALIAVILRKPKVENTVKGFDMISTIRAVAKANRVKESLALALAEDESGMKADAFNTGENAIGIFQIRPIAFQEFVNADLNIENWKHGDLFDARKNIEVGVWYLGWISRSIKQRFGRAATDLEILQAYKGGIGNFFKQNVSGEAKRLASRAFGRESKYA